MKRILYITGILTALGGVHSCSKDSVEANFEDMIDFTISDYLQDNKEEYSSFLKILEAGGIDRTLGAYNPDGLGYTLFLPGNDAVDRFIEENEQFSSLDELLADNAYAETFSRYHVVNQGLSSDEFPFGALPAYTLSGDLLTVSVVVETDTSYYVINNQAPVIKPNIEASNGYIHIVNEALTPAIYTTYGWLEQHTGYSLFLEAADATGFSAILDLNMKDEEVTERPFTLFLEHDSIFHRRGINTFEELADHISPGNNDYTNPVNPLYNFVGYHLIRGSLFLTDFVDRSSNYSTYSDIPLNVNGLGLDILINKGKMIFDTVVSGVDTTFIDYVGIYYDESNLLTQSGSLHFIDQMLEQVRPSRQIQTFEFWEEPLFLEFRMEPGSYLIEDPASLLYITWSGPDLFYTKEAEEDFPAWSQDYISLEGDFSVSYHIPEIVQGNYMVLLNVEAFSSLNALVEVFIDGKKLGGLLDLSSGGTPDDPFIEIELGVINFLTYEDHTVEVRSLIPGRFSWDYIRFEPY